MHRIKRICLLYGKDKRLQVICRMDQSCDYNVMQSCLKGNSSMKFYIAVFPQKIKNFK